MLPVFLVPEGEVSESGTGPALDLGDSEKDRPDLLSVTLGVTHILEQESLDIQIQGSEDGVNWLTKPLLKFSQKFYCGTYQMLLDVGARRGVRYVRANWSMNRWGRGSLKPLFGMYLFVQEQRAAAMAKVVGA